MIKFLTMAACPECGCTEVTGFRASNKLPNGEFNERKSWECGLELHYGPATGKAAISEDCSRSPRAVAWKQRRADIAQAMVDAIKVAAGLTDEQAKGLAYLQNNLRIDLAAYRDILEVQP